MGMFKTNKVKCDIGSYIHYWRGIKKSGKTTLFYDLVQEQYGDLNKGLLISIGDEIGYQALDDLVYAEAPDWSTLIEVIDELVDNKSDNEFEVVALDTVDELVKIAQEEVKRIHKKQKGQTAEFNACLGGYGAPRKKVEELIDEVLAKLRKSGYGIIVIGHTKLRDVKEKNGDEYQQLTSNLSADYDGIFANKADIVMTIDVEKNIDENKHINGTTRYMYFRSDGFIDAGGRFSDMPDRIEYGVRNYINAFEIGVRGAMKNPISEKEITERKKEEKESRIKKAIVEAETSKAAKIEAELEDSRDDIIAQISNKFSSADTEVKKQIKTMLKDAGFAKLTEPEVPVTLLQSILDLFD